ncbi:hypothetical protein Pecwa_0458 [Pectobacterium parmentieri WPP163]|nr:hypothetical protein Pecwa_0458 [Pectobacterium parmentieri WPP163]
MPLLLFGLVTVLRCVASSRGYSFWGWFILGMVIDPLLAGCCIT